MNLKHYLTALLAAASLASYAGEYEDRNRIVQTAQGMFKQGEFEKLENYFATFDRSDDRVGSGIHKSSLVLHGIIASTRFTDPSRVVAIGITEDEIKREIEVKEIAFFKGMEGEIQKWRTSKPSSPLAALAMSELHIAQAFFFRGSGRASEVKPQMWEPYRNQIEKASKVLNSRELVRNKAWYLAKMRLARFADGDLKNFVLLFEEATTKHPHFYSLYFASADRLDPSWGGNLEAFEWLANSAVSKTRLIDGQSLYARIYWYISSMGYDELFVNTSAEWPKMRAGFEDLNLRYPSDWNLNAYARFACLAKDRNSLKSVFNRIGERIEFKAWNDQVDMVTRCIKFANEK